MPRRFAMILAGGSGLRFWPKSRAVRPKQLLRLAGERPLVRETADRLMPAFSPEDIFCVTAAAHARGVREALDHLPPENILEEPEGRDTAAAIALFAAFARKRDPGGAFCVLPADHWIAPREGFQKALSRAFEAAERLDAPLTFGIKPRSPSTQYGYLQRGERVSDHVHRVVTFREKPDPETARQLVASGDWMWNSGMFVWRTDVILERIRRFLPGHAAAMEIVAAAFGTPREADALRSAYAGLEKISIDYGVMEKTGDAVLIEADFEWSDVGSWAALPEIRTRGEGGNVIEGKWSGVDTRECVILAPEDRLIATLGLEGMVVVQTEDATLVAPRDRVQELKRLVERLRKDGREEHL